MRDGKDSFRKAIKYIKVIANHFSKSKRDYNIPLTIFVPDRK